MNNLSIPVFSYEDLRKRADSFLAKHHPSRKIPVPIEEIVELQMGINIIPLPNLHDLLEIDGFVSGDLKEISVDEFVYNKRPTRYRFTLAHEIGHITLHSEIYQTNKFKTSKEWKDFINSIPEKDHSWLEYQAYAFAGLILVPREHLDSLTSDCVKKVRGEGISIPDNWDFVWERIADYLAKEFQVSSQVIDKRLNKDNIPNKYR